MTEYQLIKLWNKCRNQLIFAQLAPTFLLITTVGMVSEIQQADRYTIFATLGILLASGILGALAEFSAAHEAQKIASDIKALKVKSHLSQSIVKNAKWLHVAKYLTPAIFVGIFICLVATLVTF